jgi:hypothetical protein
MKNLLSDEAKARMWEEGMPPKNPRFQYFLCALIVIAATVAYFSQIRPAIITQALAVTADQQLMDAANQSAFKESAMRTCVASATAHLTNEKAQAYCRCYSDKLAETITMAEAVAFHDQMTISDSIKIKIRAAAVACRPLAQ